MIDLDNFLLWISYSLDFRTTSNSHAAREKLPSVIYLQYCFLRFYSITILSKSTPSLQYLLNFAPTLENLKCFNGHEIGQFLVH